MAPASKRSAASVGPDWHEWHECLDWPSLISARRHSSSDFAPAFARLRRGKQDGFIGGYSTGINTSCYRDAIRDSRIITTSPTNRCGPARDEWPFRLRFAQNRGAQLGLAPTLAVFASRSAISTPPRFARNCSARATLAVFVETHPLRTSDAARAQIVSRKPS
jgi:hypothetical protein